MKLYEKSSVKTIAEDVSSFALTLKGDLLYLINYNLNEYYGDLFVYMKNKSKIVNVKVSAIVPVVFNYNEYMWKIF